MSTLGSMARAAEYAAAQSARARQVSHELEDQKLPPRPTPVSLSAFTKDQPITRNKGNKAWKPLTTDDLGSDGNYSDDIINTSRGPTPFYPGDAELPTTSHFLMKTTTTESFNQGIKIPTAPKAMLMQRDRPAIPLESTPRRLTHPVMSYLQHNPNAAEGAVNQGPQGLFNLNMQQSSNHPLRNSEIAYLHEMQYPGPMTNRADTMPAQPMYGHEQHPATYMTPSREEIEVMRERDRQHIINQANLQSGFAQYQASPQFAALSASPAPLYNPADYDHDGRPHFDPATYDAPPTPFYAAQQLNARNERANAYQSTPPSYQAPRSNTNQTSSLYHPEHRKPEIQYDRAQMLEQCKAQLAKEALEKKGKTVLHNPELHKAQGSPHRPSSSDNIIADKQHENNLYDGTPWSDLEDIVKAKEKRRDATHVHAEENEGSSQELPYDMSKKWQTDVFASHTNGPSISMTGPPPGLEFPMDNSCDLEGAGLKEFPEDFYTLKRLSMAERKTVQQLSQDARDDLAGTHKTPFLKQAPGSDVKGAFRQPLFSTIDGENVNTVRAREAEKNFYGSSKAEVSAYDQEVAATVHAAVVRDGALTQKGEEETAWEKAMLAQNIAQYDQLMGKENIAQVMGKVIGNVSNVWDQCKMPEKQRSYGFKIKPVPEHAIVRPSVVTGAASPWLSFFEDDEFKGESEKAFSSAPRRIARDPRFRPAAPEEALKLTVEEKKARRDHWAGRRGN